MNRVVLNKEEAGWVSRNVPKMLQLLEASERMNKGVKERSTYRLLSQVIPQAEQVRDALKAFGDEPFEIEMYLNRKQKLLIRQLIKTTNGTLKNGVIPEYERRSDAKYRPYLVNAKKKSEMLDQLEAKFR